MYGAILGDMIGAPYEFAKGGKTKDFPLFSGKSEFTDDTVMTLAVAEALRDTEGLSDEKVRSRVKLRMRRRGRLCPDAGRGGKFLHFIKAE